MTLAGLLARIGALTDELAAVLDREAAALRDRYGRGLAGIVEEKTALLGELETCSGHLARALGTDAGPDDAATVNQRLERAGHGEQWRHIRARLAECRRGNEDNGLLIEAGRNLNGNLLEIIRGTPAAGTYSASGRLGPGTGYNTIAEA